MGFVAGGIRTKIVYKLKNFDFLKDRRGPFARGENFQESRGINSALGVELLAISAHRRANQV